MQKVINFYKPHINKEFLLSCVYGFLILLASLVTNFYAGMYAIEKASNPVTDIILSNVPLFDIDGIFNYGSVAMIIFIIIVCLFHPKKIPFALKSIGLFYLIRSIFMTLTHLGPFPTRMVVDPASYFNYFNFGADLFFSGHTGLPFLVALIFWEKKWLRITFLCMSIIFAVVVLLAHLHYSIDVLAAFFITYSIFVIAKKVFEKDVCVL